MAAEKLFLGDLIEVRPPQEVKSWVDVRDDFRSSYGTYNNKNYVDHRSFKHAIIGVVLGEFAESNNKLLGFKYWTQVFTYDLRILWFPTKHLVLRKRGG